eukprot:TRINITY_DN64156_c0_g1_i1.p1 TRINITY_DN64156_c0_g1~~TRINITY_DN64156_c0_g1_i1.p1  ORF type:complete len:426 (-),score=53.96 TRINITY_DN64156_c0_g1_i1:74-1192(-)
MSQLSTYDDSGLSSPFRASPGGPNVDALELLAAHGANAFRMRLWNDPCADGRCDPSLYKYANLDGVLEMARRCKAAGLAFILDFHYSDWWADPGKQKKPTAWAHLDWSHLEDAIKNFTQDSVAALVMQGTPPLAIQIGNEISNGMLWNDVEEPCASGGRLHQYGRVHSDDPACKIGPSWKRFGKLVAGGIVGAREACATCEIAIHTDLGNHIMSRGIHFVIEWYNNLTLALKNDVAISAAVSFDRIGLSMYPRWDGGRTMQSLAELTQLAKAFPSKKIYIAETAYPAGGAQPEHNYPATEAGQLSYLQDVLKGLRAAVPEGQRGGVLWWEGKEGSYTSVFDSQYVARPALLKGFAPESAPTSANSSLDVVFV